MERMIPHLRIYGDNIIECERALHLIARAFTSNARFIPSLPNVPRYVIQVDQTPLVVELLPGHGRWKVNVQNIIRARGGLLRESADFVVTRCLIDMQREDILFAGEFCSALPAGNNAWQRQGRAFSCASAGIPYLYYAELGGLELTEDRSVKSSRLPNPIIPFSYAVSSRVLDSICLPVYASNPSSPEAMKTLFRDVFGVNEGLQMVRAILEGGSSDQARQSLLDKALEICEILSSGRRSVDTLRSTQWREFYNLTDPNEKAIWLEQNPQTWQKRVAEKVVVTGSFKQLFRFFTSDLCLSVGASEIPICMVPARLRPILATFVKNLYGQPNSLDFIEWLENTNMPLIVVWITGFKPQGDDSRPDRGLLPLARMLFGSDIPILSIVSGPAKAFTWDVFRKSRMRLSDDNGLWETILNLSDGLIVDSATNTGSPIIEHINRVRPQEWRTISSNSSMTIPEQSELFASPLVSSLTEHDVDSTLHLVFSQRNANIFESMCNPPGGDWSGLSIIDPNTGVEYRWTSLPRVSGPGTKRPDHVVQFWNESGIPILLCIESKDRSSRLEPNVGNGLTAYVHNLLSIAPICEREPEEDWKRYQGRPILDTAIFLSGGAFLWSDEASLGMALERGLFDIVIGVELDLVEERALLHIKTIADSFLLISVFRNAINQLYGRIEIQIH